MSKTDLTYKRLHETLHYDPKTGLFTWLHSHNGVKKGMEAGSYSQGYRIIGINGKSYKASRLAFLYMEGYFPENDVDHINRIRNDDRWCNLREVTRRCNSINCALQKNNTSGITGVRYIKRIKKWEARIKVNYKGISIGVFKSKNEAVIARFRAEKKYKFNNCNLYSAAYLYLKERDLL